MKGKVFLGSLISCLLYACATVFSPPGGPKDETPPENVAVSPPMLAKNVETKKFVFEFDEFIKLNNPFNEILISPPLKNRADYKIKGKKLIVNLNDTLQENTTYTINFGQAIADNNEGNKLVGLNYVFSTGNQIDSLSISGTIKEAFTNKPAENTGVLLYEAETFTDSSFQKEKPFYYAISNSSGNFQFKYLRAGNYKVFALKDENFNIRYDPPGEEVGFIDSIIQLDAESTITLNLKRFKSQSEPKINAYSIDKQNIVHIEFNQSINEIELLKTEGLEEQIHQIWNKNRDTLKLYYKYLSIDRPEIQLRIADNEPDTLRLKSKTFTQDSIKNLEAIWTPISKGTKNLDLGNPLFLDFERAIELPTGGIYLYEDSFAREKNIRLEIDPLKPERLLVHAKYKPETRYDIVVTDSSVQDYYGIKNKAFKMSYQSNSLEDYGNLYYSLTELDSSQQYVLEVLREGKLFERHIIKNQSSFEKEWKLLKPGKMQFRIILDKDRNNRWTTGDIERKIQPEPIYVYPDEVNIRGNWDLEVEDKPSFNLH